MPRNKKLKNLWKFTSQMCNSKQFTSSDKNFLVLSTSTKGKKKRRESHKTRWLVVKTSQLISEHNFDPLTSTTSINNFSSRFITESSFRLFTTRHRHKLLIKIDNHFAVADISLCGIAREMRETMQF